MSWRRCGQLIIGLLLLCVLVTYSLYVTETFWAPARRVEAADVRSKGNYFPDGSISDFEQSWYAKHLLAMKEPVLSPDGKGKSYLAVRLLYLPTWGRPVAVRYQKKDDGFSRRAVKLSGSGGYDPGQIADQKESSVDKKEVSDLIIALEKAGFWKLPQKDDVIGADGSQCIIEVIKEGEYRVRVRWTPDYEAEKRSLAGLVALYTSQFRAVGFWKDRDE